MQDGIRQCAVDFKVAVGLDMEARVIKWRPGWSREPSPSGQGWLPLFALIERRPHLPRHLGSWPPEARLNSGVMSVAIQIVSLMNRTESVQLWTF
jgi:hypothetical protein